MSSWVRTPVVAFFLKTAVGNDFDAESKLMTVSKWFRQWNDSMNYDFHHITILLASIKNWKAPPVDIAIAIEKQACPPGFESLWYQSFQKEDLRMKIATRMKPKSLLNRSPKPSCTFLKKPIGDVSQEASNVTNQCNDWKVHSEASKLLRPSG